MSYVFLALGGFLGAICRYLVVEIVSNRFIGFFPWGTFLVNLGGTMGLGFIIGRIEIDSMGLNYDYLLTGGFLASFTTFSTFNSELINLWLNNKRFIALSYLSLSILGMSLFFLVGFRLA